MSTQSKARKIQPPKGTRDLYPEDVLRSRYITNAWRDAAIRCGFDEIEGPTFESTDLYAVKSGEGILGELFQAFSGKSESEIEQVKSTGQAPYALRPEFTPTLARMYAAHAKQLPKPCKWFTAGPYFRAERPQRGRLREFLQWNVDAIGLPGDEATPESTAQMDAEVIESGILLFQMLGLTKSHCNIRLNDRKQMTDLLANMGVEPDKIEIALEILDRQNKAPSSLLVEQAKEAGIDCKRFYIYLDRPAPDRKTIVPSDDGDSFTVVKHGSTSMSKPSFPVLRSLGERDLQRWCEVDSSIVRGLAYYTGTVFEAIAEGERAVMGGGRYDNLIELFGGPPTPACGFGMGDVVLSNLLTDKGLMPEGVELMEAAARPQASIRPDAFVVPNGDEENEALVHTLTANLRRGIESDDWLGRDDRKPWNRDRYRVEPMHARISYKSTRNLKKLRADAEKQHARCFVEIHAHDKVELTDMDRRESLTSDTPGSFSVDPSAENYVGAAIAARLGARNA